MVAKSPSGKKTIIEVRNLTKTFTDRPQPTHVLRGIDLDIHEGEFVAIMGRSGAGKSTLLYQMSLLDTPTAGTITINGKSVESLSSDARTEFRLTELGYVFQDYSLLPELTACENIMIPLLMQGVSRKVAEDRAVKALVSVDLGHRADNLPSGLSGGEQQRVSIARAITHKPRILFADEPTANLDSTSSKLVMDIFKRLNVEERLTVVMVTHEEDFMSYADKVVRIHDGVIIDLHVQKNTTKEKTKAVADKVVAVGAKSEHETVEADTSNSLSVVESETVSTLVKRTRKPTKKSVVVGGAEGETSVTVAV